MSSFLRALGTVVVFAVVGPLAIALASVLAVTALGSPFYELFNAVTGLTISRNWMVIGFMLFVGAMAVSSVSPSFLAGMVFAIAAFVFGWSAMPVSWFAAALAVLIFALVGVVATPSENSPLIVASVGSVPQALYLALFLLLPACAASSLAWLLSRPLHRGIA